METSDIEALVAELDTRVDRLRSLYEQYFMGIEKMEPHVPKKDVERRIQTLRKEQIRNTALRFRFQMILQRYNTYQTYWMRICRQIEEGTYKRDLVRARSRFAEEGARARGQRAAIALDDAEALDDLDILPPSVAVPMLDDPFPVPLPSEAKPPSKRPPPLPPRSRTVAPGAGAPGVPPSTAVPAKAGPPVPPPKPAPPGPAPKPPVPGSIAKPDAPPIAKPAIPTLAKPPTLPNAVKLGIPTVPATPEGPTTAAKRGVPPPLTKPASPAAPPKVEAPPSGPTLPTKAAPRSPSMPDLPPTSAKPGVPAPIKPAPPAAPRADLPDTRVKELYAQYVETRRKQNESTATLTYDGLAKALRDTTARLKDKHGGKTIDFEVVVRDGKTVLRPVVK